MTANDAKKLLIEQQENDAEPAHIVADDILCKFLSDLGYTDVVYEYEQISKWYS